jgi:acetoin utilization deacetylase AcuC-like enzyme
MLLVASPRFEAHVTPPGHPERMERAHVFNAVAARRLEKGGRVASPRAATREELERVHDPAYLDRIAATAGSPGMLDADTFVSPESHDVALLAAGATIQAAEHALDHDEPAFALVGPPGHHAERDRAMGFCLYNNAAVAAAAALARGVARVAVVDIDVHHGNGTQWMFYDDPRVLYVSTHQFPFYPGTGAADDVGVRDGAGFTLNVPLEAGATDADYDFVYRALVAPVLDEFAPGLVIVSAGYDAHERDPLASMRVSIDGYAAIVRRLAHVATRHGALALVTEGGYDLDALAGCLDATIGVVDGGYVLPPVVDGPSPRGERAAAAVRAAQAAFWRGI